MPRQGARANANQGMRCFPGKKTGRQTPSWLQLALSHIANCFVANQRQSIENKHYEHVLSFRNLTSLLVSMQGRQKIADGERIATTCPINDFRQRRTIFFGAM